MLWRSDEIKGMTARWNLENLTNTLVSLLLPQTPVRECSGAEVINSPGPGCNSAEGTARERRCSEQNIAGPAVDCILSTSSAVNPGSCLYCTVMCKLRPSFTYHFPQRSTWRIGIHACSAGSKLREKQQLRWKECPESPWAGICSCSSSVFSGPSFFSSQMKELDCWPGLQGLLEPWLYPHRIESGLLLSLTIISVNSNLAGTVSSNLHK